MVTVPTYTLTGNATDLVNAPASLIRGYVEASQPIINDVANNKQHYGRKEILFGGDGTWSVTGLTATGALVSGYRVVVFYRDALSKKIKQNTSNWFALTQNTNFGDVFSVALELVDVTVLQSINGIVGTIDGLSDDLNNLNTVTLPAVQASLDNLNNSTLPGVQSQLYGLQGLFPITTTSISDNAISTPKLQTNSVSADKIVANAITADKIAANSVSADKIVANTITGDRIAANTISADKIVANSIGADRIAANSITSDKLTANAIDGKTINGGTIVGGAVYGATVATAQVGARVSLEPNSNSGAGSVLFMDGSGGTIGQIFNASSTLAVRGPGAAQFTIASTNTSTNTGFTAGGSITAGGSVDATGNVTGSSFVSGAEAFGTGANKPAYITNAGRITATAPSSGRFKRDVEPIRLEEAAGAVALQAVSYRYNPGMDYGDDLYLGVIGEQAAEVGLERWVTRDAEGLVSGFRYDWLPLAQNVVIADHDTRVAALEQEVADLQNRLAALEQRMSA